jgi:hypothetical protein
LKYEKRGFNIEIKFTGDEEMINEAELTYFNSSSYFSMWKNIYFPNISFNMKKTEKTEKKTDPLFSTDFDFAYAEEVVPYHVFNFFRLLKLFKYGGIFSDFSFIFLGPLFSSSVSSKFKEVIHLYFSATQMPPI